MDRDLDALIGSIFDDEDAAPGAASEAPADAAPEDAGLALEAAEDPVAETPADLDEDAAEVDAAPEEPDVTPPPPAQPSGPSTDDYRQMQERLAAQNDQLARYQQWQQAQAAQAQIAALQARWAEMDPQDAHREEVQFLAQTYQAQLAQATQRLQTLEQQRIAEQEARAEAEAKPLAIQRAIAHYGLRPDDAELLETVVTAEQLDQLAQKLKATRVKQTEAARKQKAANVAANPALKGGGGGTATSAPRPAPKDIDEFVDQLFAL